MKTVLITGISRGIGRAIAAKFHEAGYQLVGCSRSADSVRAFQEDYNMAEVYVCDLSDKEQVKDFARQVLDKHTIDVLVNNAGVFVPGAMLTEEDGVYEEMMRANVDSVYYLCKAIVEQMRANKSGTIVNICSVASLMGYPAGGTYTVSKHALLGLSRAMREELKPDGIRVTSIMPGATLTDSWAGVDLPEERFIPVEAVAQMVYAAATLPASAVVEDMVIRPQLGDI